MSISILQEYQTSSVWDHNRLRQNKVISEFYLNRRKQGHCVSFKQWDASSFQQFKVTAPFQNKNLKQLHAWAQGSQMPSRPEKLVKEGEKFMSHGVVTGKVSMLQ